MTKLTKREVQSRVLQNGKPLALDKFIWNADTRTFSSQENGLVIDFAGINNCILNMGSNCSVETGNNCSCTTGPDCSLSTGWHCTVDAGGGGVIINNYKPIAEIHILKAGEIVRTLPSKFKGFLINGIYKGEPHILKDGILSKILSKMVCYLKSSQKRKMINKIKKKCYDK